jgi:hypothetical protein
MKQQLNTIHFLARDDAASVFVARPLNWNVSSD